MRLEAWATYENQPANGLGYSSITPIAKMMELRTVCSSGNNAVAIVPNFKMDSRCAEVGVGVLALPKSQRIVMYSKYCTGTKKADITKETGFKPREYYKHLERAEIFLSGWLGYAWEE